MQIPAELREAISTELARHERSDLTRAVSSLTSRYRDGQFAAPAMRTQADRAAYVAVRMPATYGAVLRALQEVARGLRRPCASLLDLGAGPGTTMWAATQVWPIEKITCVERDAQLMSLGRELASSSRNEALRSATWMQADIAAQADFPAHDIVVLSYAIGELAGSAQVTVIERAVRAARQALVVVEPGTPAAFDRIHRIREQLIEYRMALVAPCPHEQLCPMKATNDWCHFAARVERTADHRRLKGGDLGYEDEKYSYVAAARCEITRPASRILRHPMKYSGYVELVLCRPERPEQRRVTKSQKAIYRDARGADWGDAWAPEAKTDE